MFVLLTATSILLVLGIIEKYRHQQRLLKIPIRIHVNGTRGKSLLTRMLVDLFLHAEFSVAARVTGEKPQYFITGQGWQSWPRSVPARIKELWRFIKQISPKPPQVLVLENMALAPENLFAAENYLVQSTLAVFTNFRADHQEIWGEGTLAAVRALLHALPRNATLLLTAEDAHLPVVANIARLKTKVLTAAPPVIPESAEFGVFETQFRLVKAIAAHYHLPPRALAETLAAWKRQLVPDRRFIPIRRESPPQTLVNLFTCNDVPSVKIILQNLERQQLIAPPYDVLLISRVDRPLRTLAFLTGLLPDLTVNTLILAGKFPRLALRRWIRKNSPPFRVVVQPGKISPEAVLAHCDKKSAFVLGLGNFVETGEKILEFLKKSNHDN